jgi:hypothetical protein
MVVIAQITCSYRRHAFPPARRLSRRAMFQISPHLPQRQYVFSSGLFDVVVIDDDWQAGHAEGMSAESLDRVPPSGRGPNERIGLSINLLQGAPARTENSNWQTALRGRATRPHSKALVRAGPGRPRAQKSRRCDYTLEPSELRRIPVIS